MESQPARRHFMSKLHLNKSNKFCSYPLNTATLKNQDNIISALLCAREPFPTQVLSRLTYIAV